MGIYFSPLQKIFSKGFSTSPLFSHFPHTVQPIMFTHLVTIFTTFTNYLLFAEFSRHVSSDLTLLFFTLPFSLKCPFLWHLRLCFSFSFLCFWPLRLPANASFSLSFKCQATYTLKSSPSPLLFIYSPMGSHLHSSLNYNL